MAGIFDLTGRRVMVTGGARGIGGAIVRAFARAGARVAIADADLPGAQALAGEIGDAAAAFAIDVRDRTSVEGAFAKIVAHFGGLDILAANAGVSTMQRDRKSTR